MYAVLHAVCVLLALSPFDIWPLGFVAVAAIFWAVQDHEHAGFSRLFNSAFLFAIAVTCITFGWIIFTIHRYTGGYLLLTFFLTVLYALLFQGKFILFFLIRRFVFRVNATGPAVAVAICALVAIADMLSPELFPWSWGNTLAAEPHLRELASVGSVYFVSFVAALGGYILFRRFRNCALSTALFVMLSLCGLVLRYAPGPDATETVNILVVQTNIGAAPESRRGDAAFAADAIGRLFNQTVEGLMLHPHSNLVIWPEASMPFHSAEANAENSAIYSVTFDGVLEYITRTSGSGVIFQDMGFREKKLYSRLNVRPAASDVAVFQYVKRRLVPWGEYLPGENMFPALRGLFAEAGRFSSGSDRDDIKIPLLAGRAGMYNRAQLTEDLQILSSPDKIAAKYPAPVKSAKVLRIKPLLCYEALYPADARSPDADLIMNLSSDAWFGDGVEGQQHASAALLRSVENGVPMIRAAMSGTSAVVDRNGIELVPRSGQGRPEILYAEVPLRKSVTLFARFGMSVFYLIMFIAVLPAAIKQLKAFYK